MAKKKKSPRSSPFDSVTSKQVIDGDTLTIEEVRKFIADAKKYRQDWLNIADRSWNEIRKRNKRGKLYGGNDLDRARRWARYPLWWSTLQIREPITLSRLPIPVIKDTQGDDPYGRTACVVGERLTRGILKTFDAITEFQAGNTDFLVTDFGYGRVCYRMKEVKEEEKIRLQEIQQEAPPQMEGETQEQETAEQPEAPLPPIYITPDGEQVYEPLFDDLGAYIKSGELINVEQEEVYFEAGQYCGLLMDDVNRYPKATRLAFEYAYSYREFKEKFGKSALDKIATADIEEHRMGKPITVYEYHDKLLKEVRFFADNSEDFFQPKGMSPEDLNEVGSLNHSDIYGLSNFFPCTAPLIINAPTDEFWPTPEFFQVVDILELIHDIVGRMTLLTKAIRVRFFFDSSIPALKQLVGETGEGGGIGIPNLEQALMNGKGSLANLVAYMPVDEMIQGLKNMYEAFSQQTNMYYQVTGISDLLRGQTADGDKTYGERQLEGKFALNRIEPRQRKVQEWIKDNYQLLMEMALKMFSDKTLDEYITPQTLDQEDQQRYVAALELLKENKRSRFRMDFETDSTININQQWKKQQAVELANTLTKAMEATAKTAETQPELAKTELSVLKHLIGEFSDGKLFIDEIQDSIQQVIDKMAQPKDDGPNIELEKLKLEGAKFGLEQEKLSVDARFREIELQSKERIEIEKINRDDRLANLESQIAQFRIQGEQALKNAELQGKFEGDAANLEKEYQKISADISLEQQKLALQRDELLVELRKIVDKKEVDQFAAMIDERVLGFEQQLEAARFELEKTNSALDLKERYLTEQRLQAEHQMQITQEKFSGLEKLIDVAIKHKELTASPEIKDVEEVKPKKPRKTRSKVIRDKNGNISEILNQEED